MTHEDDTVGPVSGGESRRVGGGGWGGGGDRGRVHSPTREGSLKILWLPGEESYGTEVTYIFTP